MKNVADLLRISLSESEFNNDDWVVYCDILAQVIDANHDISSLTYEDIREGLENIDSNYKEDDFYFEFDGMEYRVIHDSDIWDIYVETIKNIVEDCYSDVIKLDKIPAFIAVSIDWEATAHNAYSDGYAHTFATYDGQDIGCVHGFNIFRTN